MKHTISNSLGYCYNCLVLQAYREGGEVELLKKKVLGVSLIILLLLAALFGCSSKGDKAAFKIVDGAEIDAESVINVFNYAEYIPDSVIEKFEKKYGVKVNYSYFASNEEMVAKLAINSSAFDVVFGADHGIAPMIERRMVQKIDLDKVPNFKYIDTAFRDNEFDPNNEYTVAFMGSTVSMAVNPDLIKTEITSYADLWKPELKSQIVLTEDPRFVLGMVLKTLGYSANDTDPSHLEQAKQKMIELMPNVRVFDSDNPKSLLMSEEVGVALTWGSEIALAQEEMPQLTTILPKEGLLVAADYMMIPTGAKHKKTAEEFINFILDPEISAEISESFPYINPNMEARKLIDERILNNIAVYPPEEVMKQSEALLHIGDTNQLIDRIWTEIKSYK